MIVLPFHITFLIFSDPLLRVDLQKLSATDNKFNYWPEKAQSMGPNQISIVN